MATRFKFNSGTAQSRWLWAVPFFLPSVFFQSSLFAFISPLPFFVATLKSRSWISSLALITNASILYAMDRNVANLALPLWYWFSIGISFPLFIRKLKRVPTAFFASFLLCILLLLAGIYQIAHQNHLNLVDYTRALITDHVDQLLAIQDHPIKKWVEEQGRSDLIHNLMVELPSGILIAIILCYWFNLLLAFRTIPGFLSRAFWGSYRNPEWLIWPTLISGFLYAYYDQALYYVGMNTLKVLLVFYGFQGLSIVTYVLNQKQIYGLIRPLIYGLIIFVASPLAFALGFFDLWFDFRRKFGQS